MNVTNLKPARFLLRPPGPRAERRRSCVSIEGGSSGQQPAAPPPKNTRWLQRCFGLISERGVISEISLRLIRSGQFSEFQALRSSSLASSSIVRSRRFPNDQCHQPRLFRSRYSSTPACNELHSKIISTKRHLCFGNRKTKLSIILNLPTRPKR